MEALIILTFWAGMAAGGWAVGERKGRPVLGTVLGIVLGIVGVGVIPATREALVRRETGRRAVTGEATRRYTQDTPGYPPVPPPGTYNLSQDTFVPPPGTHSPLPPPPQGTYGPPIPYYPPPAEPGGQS